MSSDFPADIEERLYQFEEDFLNEPYMKPSFLTDGLFYVIYGLVLVLAFIAIGYLISMYHLHFSDFGLFAVWATCVFSGVKMFLDFIRLFGNDTNRRKQYKELQVAHQKRKERLDQLRKEEHAQHIEKKETEEPRTKGVLIDEQAS